MIRRGYYRIRLVLISSVFFALGYFLKKYGQKINEKLVVTCLMMAFLLRIYLEMKNTRVTYSKEIFGNPMLAFGKYEIEDQVNFTVYVPKVDEHFVGSLAVILL